MKMKKLTKLLALSMTGGMLLIGCGETDDVDNDLPDVEDPMDEEMNEDPMDEDMDEDVE